MTDLMTKIAELAQNQMGVDNPPQPDQSLLEYGFDSLDTIEMVMAVEDEFGIEIDDATADDANTVRKIAELVAARRGGNA